MERMLHQSLAAVLLLLMMMILQIPTDGEPPSVLHPQATPLLPWDKLTSPPRMEPMEEPVPQSQKETSVSGLTLLPTNVSTTRTSRRATSLKSLWIPSLLLVMLAQLWNTLNTLAIPVRNPHVSPFMTLCRMEMALSASRSTIHMETTMNPLTTLRKLTSTLETTCTICMLSMIKPMKLVTKSVISCLLLASVLLTKNTLPSAARMVLLSLPSLRLDSIPTLVLPNKSPMGKVPMSSSAVLKKRLNQLIISTRHKLLHGPI
mmetsp:Transcript_45955/g.111317  ORF Transcript_45955/g.111317 Transcript_45955/m.111317 type:complete len:261 (+) Transcript_45955:810-1592(+)